MFFNRFRIYQWTIPETNSIGDILIFDIEDKRDSGLYLINKFKESPLPGTWKDTIIYTKTVTNTTILLRVSIVRLCFKS